MEQLSKSLRAALSQTTVEELQKPLASAQVTEHVLEVVMEKKVIQGKSEMEQFTKTEGEEWQREKKTLEAGVKATMQ